MDRRSWDKRKKYGWDSDFQDFTLTYSEGFGSQAVLSDEDILMIMAINGFSCGFPECCVLYYLKKCVRFFKSHIDSDTNAEKLAVTDLGIIYAQCPSEVHQL